jgi:HAMP domain-containing protein
MNRAALAALVLAATLGCLLVIVLNTRRQVRELESTEQALEVGPL